MQAGPLTAVDLIGRGRSALAEGDHIQAEELFRAAIAADASDVEARMLLGALLTDTHQAEKAVEVLRMATALAGPLSERTAPVYNNLANALRCAKEFDEAESLLRELCALEPKRWEYWHNLGQVLKDVDQMHEAAAALRRAVALAPEHGPNHAVLGQILHLLGRLRSADAALRRCIALGWRGDVNLWTTLGNNHRYLGELDEAQAALEEAFALSQGVGSAWNNLAIIAAQRGQFDRAINLYHEALQRNPEDGTWRANLGYAELTAGRLPQGWHDWEAGLFPGGPRGIERDFPVPRWTPDRTDDRVLCYREQGIGDEILFASCLPDLVASTREVIYEVNSRLETLFARSFPGAEVRQITLTHFGETASDFDSAIPIGSLPLHFRPTPDFFPKDRRSFLVADSTRVDKWKARHAALGDGPIVAISWRSRIKTAERRMEYTNLIDDWGPLFSIPDVTWVSVQYDDCERELIAAEQKFGVRIHRWEEVDYLDDFEEVAAIMVASDLVVAPRNAVAMLSGALGVPTVAMGNRWDWSDLGTDTLPWFPSLELVFRQPGEDWDGVIEQAARRVAAVAEAPAQRPQGAERLTRPMDIGEGAK